MVARVPTMRKVRVSRFTLYVLFALALFITLRRHVRELLWAFRLLPVWMKAILLDLAFLMGASESWKLQAGHLPDGDAMARILYTMGIMSVVYIILEVPTEAVRKK